MKSKQSVQMYLRSEFGLIVCKFALMRHIVSFSSSISIAMLRLFPPEDFYSVFDKRQATWWQLRSVCGGLQILDGIILVMRANYNFDENIYLMYIWFGSSLFPVFPLIIVLDRLEDQCWLVIAYGFDMIAFGCSCCWRVDII